MDIFTQLVYVIGRRNAETGIIEMLGTGFLARENGCVVTTYHVTGPNDDDLGVLMPRTNKIDDYQELGNSNCRFTPAKIQEIDPIRDLTILETDIILNGTLPRIGTLDEVQVGETVGIFGFPHCVEGRRALIYQRADIGAKVLMESEGVRSKHAVINTQTRPGQSGSLAVSTTDFAMLGILIGGWAPKLGGKVLVGGINPRELHQTTHCISAEYVKEML